jgi:hypothetical protein
MNHDELCQLVRIRHELRRLLPGGDAGERQENARRLLCRMRALVAPHASEQARIEPEMTRWQSVFRVSAGP